MSQVHTLPFILGPQIALMTNYKRLVELVRAVKSRVMLYSLHTQGVQGAQTLPVG